MTQELMMPTAPAQDLAFALAGMQLPRKQHVEEILAFGRAFQHEHGGRVDAHLLIHCHAGISRSTAALATLLARHTALGDEAGIFARIREIRPIAWPNSSVAIPSEATSLITPSVC